MKITTFIDNLTPTQRLEAQKYLRFLVKQEAQKLAEDIDLTLHEKHEADNNSDISAMLILRDRLTRKQLLPDHVPALLVAKIAVENYLES